MGSIMTFKEFINEAEATPQRAKFRFNISAELKKVSKIQKTLIDLKQLLSEMSNNASGNNIDDVLDVLQKKITKVARIQKTLIDLKQLLTEMSDEIIALKLNYSNLDPDSERALNEMKVVIDAMLETLRKKGTKATETGMIDNCARLAARLEDLKANPDSDETLHDMRRNINAALEALTKKEEDLKDTGLIDNSARLGAKLGELKKGFLRKKGA